MLDLKQAHNNETKLKTITQTHSGQFKRPTTSQFKHLSVHYKCQLSVTLSVSQFVSHRVSSHINNNLFSLSRPTAFNRFMIDTKLEMLIFEKIHYYREIFVFIFILFCFLRKLFLKWTIAGTCSLKCYKLLIQNNMLSRTPSWVFVLKRFGWKTKFLQSSWEVIERPGNFEVK